MAKKKLAKTVVFLGTLGIASKVAYSKYKTAKETFTKEEAESVGDEVKKYNALFEKKIIEVEDEVFTGCEIKAVSSKMVLDLGLASFEKDVYINFNSTASNLTIILPEGVNAACDVTRTASGVRNLVDNTQEDGIHTAYVIGKAVCSSVEVVPVNFYVDDEDDYEDLADENDFEVVVDNTQNPKVDETAINEDIQNEAEVTVAVEPDEKEVDIIGSAGEQDIKVSEKSDSSEELEVEEVKN